MSEYQRSPYTGSIRRVGPREVDEKREYRAIKKAAAKLGITVDEWRYMQQTGMIHPKLITNAKIQTQDRD